MSLLYTKILNKFPLKHIKFAFAYGSGVFKQTGYDNDEMKSNESSSNMIDFVFVVDDSIKFHHENLKQNASHYSFLKHLGPFYITKIQNDYGAACYYNTLVPLKLDDLNKTCLIKYGVISEDALLKDLFDWEYLYMSGRLHKPVKIIKKQEEKLPKLNIAKVDEAQLDPLVANQDLNTNTTTINTDYDIDAVNKSIDLALQTNLSNALHTALLLLPEKFTLFDLFLTIASLSYSGDLRMIVGENKNKCTNIVTPQMDRFVELYKPYLVKESIESFLSCNFETGQLTQNLNQHTIYHHLNLLPKNLIQTIINLKFKSSYYYDMEEYIYKLTNRTDYKEIVMESVCAIVRKTSTSQSAKGLLTGGLLKSTQYSLRKLKKMIK